METLSPEGSVTLGPPSVRVTFACKGNKVTQIKSAKLIKFFIIHIFLFLLLYTEGEGQIITENTTYDMSGNSLFLIPPNLIHSLIRNDNPKNYYIFIHFDMIYDSSLSHWNAFIPRGTVDLKGNEDFFCSKVSSELINSLNGKLEVDNLAIIKKLMGNIADIKRNEDELSFIQMSGLMLEIISKIILGTRSKSPRYRHYDLIQKACEYLNENINNEINLQEFEKQFGLSASHFRRLFRELLGKSPRSYHREARIKKACELLMLSNKNISEIAYEVGFSNPYNFSRAFKDIMGVSPFLWTKNNSMK